MLKQSSLIKCFFYCGCLLLAMSCVEPFEVESAGFKSAVVIEGTITDKNETQRILVSQTFPLDTVLMSGVSGAGVSVRDSNGGVYGFFEEETGVYVSNTAFAATAGLTYSLRVETPSGKTYISEDVPVPASATIENLYAERGFKDGDAEEGMFIYVDSYDPTGASKYYRYEYEETYKIIAPFWGPADAYVISGLPNPEFGTRARDREERICFNTIRSNTIIQENTTAFDEDRVSKFPVRFINRENYILSHRYSILVKQYVQTRAAFAYYETLEKLSGSESLFSQLQTGSLEGNIYAEAEDNENAIGFFQVSTVSEQRLFFDYVDYFPGERLPDFVSDCPFVSPPTLTEGGASPLLNAIEFGLVKFYEDYDTANNPLNFSEFGPYLMVPTICGDCTVLGSNEVPDFWVED